MENSNISWTHNTFNPWKGCAKVARGCKNCYAEKYSKRNPGVFGTWGPNGARVITAESGWRKPVTWDREAARAGKRLRVFCGSLCDVFEEDRPDLIPPRRRLLELIHNTPNLDWLLLTKRPEQIPLMMQWGEWPNVWLGTSVAERKDLVNMNFLRDTTSTIKCPVRFVSAEPLVKDLGEVDLTDIQWLIVGGESGPRHDDMDHEWARSLREQCKSAGVAFFFKQSSGHKSGTGTLLDGKTYHRFPLQTV
jgi:protein gp37